MVYESEHYRFFFSENSLAEQKISEIAAYQEECFDFICRMLDVTPDFKIEYTLCATPVEVGLFYGDEEPCNGFTRLPNQIFAVYNESVKCIGFHEDAHIISYCINRPPNSAVREGLAMFFDRRWWGISNFDWTLYYIRCNRCPSREMMIENESFFSLDCALTYPVVGAFTEYLILFYGIERYLCFYRYTNRIEHTFFQTYQKTLSQLYAEFIRYVSNFSLDWALEIRIKELLASNGR